MKDKPSPASSPLRKPIRILALTAALGAALAVGLTWWGAQRTGPGPETVVVYKRATCNCCSKWVEHLKQAGFEVEVHNTSDLASHQNEWGVPAPLRACHTALVGGYVIEGHVPAEDIRRLLTSKPQARGIAVPGMPIGSPGMEQGEQRDPYATVLFQTDGQHQAFAQHGEPPR